MKTPIPILSCVLAFLVAASFSACSTSKGLEERYQSDIAQVRSVQAEHTAELTQIRQELRQLAGQAEEIQHHARGKTEELERTIQRFSTRVPPPEGVPEDLLNQDEQAIVKNSGEAADLFKNGLQQLRAGDFENSQQTFAHFVELNPDTSFSDNALFWAGVCYEKLGDYGRAIGSYNDVYTRYPAEDRVPAALYRMGESFAQINSINDARDTFKKVADDYPRSSYAPKARARLSKLPQQKRR